MSNECCPWVLQTWWICHVDFWLEVSQQKNWVGVKSGEQGGHETLPNCKDIYGLEKTCSTMPLFFLLYGLLHHPVEIKCCAGSPSWNKKFSYHNSVSFITNCWSCSIITFEALRTEHRGSSYSTPHSDTKRVQWPFLDFLRVFVASKTSFIREYNVVDESNKGRILHIQAAVEVRLPLFPESVGIVQI